jgi:hypothetical protein
MVMKPKTLRLGVVLLAVTLAETAAAAPPDPVALAPHRAIYDITLGTVRAGAGVVDLSGRMVYELTGSRCEGYTQNMRFVTRMTNQEGNATVTDLRSSSWENDAADQFRFNSSQHRDEQPGEQTAGDAARNPSSGEVKVQLTKPAKKIATLAGRPLFPIQHSIKLIDAARAGQTVFAADLYDGSEKGEKVYATNAFVGAKLAPGFNKTLPPVKGAEKLDDVEAWPVSISYYEKGKNGEDLVPAYELAFVFFDNGVSRRIFIDYGEFSIKGELKELTMLEEGKCEPGKR